MVDEVATQVRVAAIGICGPIKDSYIIHSCVVASMVRTCPALHVGDRAVVWAVLVFLVVLEVCQYVQVEWNWSLSITVALRVPNIECEDAVAMDLGIGRWYGVRNVLYWIWNKSFSCDILLQEFGGSGGSKIALERGERVRTPNHFLPSAISASPQMLSSNLYTLYHPNNPTPPSQIHSETPSRTCKVANNVRR